MEIRVASIELKTSMPPIDQNPTTKELQDSYDQVPYPNHAKPFTYIARLAAVGRLNGLNTVSPDRCRVLELGCADGGNLLPMAIRFPQSQFVGIDLSPVQIEMGQNQAAQLSVSNLDLFVQDILQIQADDLDEFDYIIVHGVFSWVPVEVQDKLLNICRDHLSKDGMAYISFNSLPGWHGKQALRNMLRYHTRDIEDVQQKAQEAMRLVSAFPSLDDLPDEPGSILVHQLRQNLANIDDPLTYLVHEYLIDTNAPMYFHEFLQRIDQVDLRYIDDAYPGSAALDRLPPGSRQWVCETFANHLDQQQYIDFFCNISFRRSLVCHNETPTQKELTLSQVDHLFATATCRLESFTDNGTARFINDPGRVFSVGHPGIQAALTKLVEARPASIAISQLKDLLGDHLSDEDAAAMFGSLLRNAAIELSTHPFDCVADVGEKPFASKLVRYQAESGTVTGANHRPVGLSNLVEQHLIPMLDGTQTLRQLTGTLSSRLKPDPPKSEEEWDELIQSHLSRLAKAGVLSTPEPDEVA